MSFQRLFDFESALAQYTGAPYAVVTDCCTHALELCFRYDAVTECKITPYTYLSIPQLLTQLGIKYTYLDHAWQRWVGEYPFLNTRIWDSARKLQPGMYRTGQLQCLSFGHGKPLQIGRCGAILTDDADAYAWLSRARSDGRDLHIAPWELQKDFAQGYHYCPTLESCAIGLEKLQTINEEPKYYPYPDLRNINVR
jgi:dTDP-4-amino-4,6-dideoxygalactose transaminase